MSVKLMALVWELELSTFEKLVMLALADCANDDGECWPSVATLSRKTGAAERTVQRSLRSLEQAGLLKTITVAGRGNRYWLNPRHSGTPATQSPVTETTQTPATVAPHPRHSGTQTIREPSLTVKGAKAPKRARVPLAIVPQPDGVSDVVWRDFQKYRKDKGAPLTETALAGIEREAGKAGWTLEAALIELQQRGWQGFKASWVEGKQNGRTNTDRQIAPDGRTMGKTEAAVRAIAARVAGPGECGGNNHGPVALPDNRRAIGHVER